MRTEMTQDTQIEQITRSLAYMLRHKPEEFDLELDRYGAASVDDVLHALEERLGVTIEEDELLDAIHAGDRLRYDVHDGRIRALYGHSIQVDPGESTKPPEMLYVGLGSRDAERAERYGLRGARVPGQLTPVGHVFTHLRVTLHPTVLRVSGASSRASEGGEARRWVSRAAIAEHALPTATRKVLSQLWSAAKG
ncbi:MAG: RNA 2'-phosphotransferase [Myxococcales bacterium]|nr:RNA 2'-phosphotransferase [Myxococcales bacterium]